MIKGQQETTDRQNPQRPKRTWPSAKRTGDHKKKKKNAFRVGNVYINPGQDQGHEKRISLRMALFGGKDGSLKKQKQVQINTAQRLVKRKKDKW